MINLFNNQPKKEAVKQAYTIEDVHNDFNKARIKIYEEAQHHVNTSNFQVNPNLERLNQLGFSNPKSRNYLINKRAFESNVKISNIVLNYKVKYPANRFINHEELVAIINKYKLVVSGVENFIGEIPERNIKEIANFKLKEEDVFYVVGTPGVIGSWRMDYDDYKKQSESRDFSVRFREPRQKFYNDGSKNFELLSEAEKTTRDSFRQSSDLMFDISRKNQDTFIVIGTPDQFDMARVNQQIESLVNNDPIVLCPVLEGYLIVTMWGEEAEFPETKDSKLN